MELVKEYLGDDYYRLGVPMHMRNRPRQKYVFVSEEPQKEKPKELVSSYLNMRKMREDPLLLAA